jgi:hypothetical protein
MGDAGEDRIILKWVLEKYGSSNIKFSNRGVYQERNPRGWLGIATSSEIISCLTVFL